MDEKKTKTRTTPIKRLVIGDIDGVVADCSNRLEYLKDKNWDKFYGAEMANDEYIKINGDLLLKLSVHEYAQLVFLTGRPERTQELTRLWLNEHLEDADWWITCRRDGDHRKSSVVKAEMMSSFLTSYESIFDENMTIYIFDDDPVNLIEMKKVVEKFMETTRANRRPAPNYTWETFCVGTERIKND